MISILIASKNRPKQLIQCLKSIEDSAFKNYEIIVLYKNKTSINKELSCFKNVIYEKVNHIKKSTTLNRGIEIAKGEILAFTDDDCVIDKYWLTTIEKIFLNNPRVSGIFGKSLPYKPQLHGGLICPCTFNKPKVRFITKPCNHWENIGFGNNMAFRKKVFDRMGVFKTWLGPGSIGSNAEDAEIALRSLIQGYTLMYTPDMVIHHNKWLSSEQMKKQQLSYICGEMACYGYFYFQKHLFAKSIIINNIKHSQYQLKCDIKNIFALNISRITLRNISYSIKVFLFRLRGLFVGYYFSIVDSLR